MKINRLKSTRKLFYTCLIFIILFFFVMIFSPGKIEKYFHIAEYKYLYKTLSAPILETCFFQEPRLACLGKLEDHSINPNCFINDTVLKNKIRKGLPKWAKEQIKEDLSKFPHITKKDLDRYVRENTEPSNIIARIQVKNKTVKITYADPHFNPRSTISHMHAGNVIKYVLEYLAERGYILDSDFVICLADFYKPISNEVVPIFTFSKNFDIPVEKDLILIPDWQNLGSIPSLRERIRTASKLISWNEKKNVLFWRGGEWDSTGFRKKLVSFSKENPTLIDAVFTEKWNPKNRDLFTTPEGHLNYKYLISIDGQRCSWERFVWHLHSNSLVFKHQSNQVQWFYKGIKPFVDYIPVTDENSILKNIAWSEKHPKEVQSIIHHASNFAEENLSLEDMYHYIMVLLQEYHKKLIN